MTKAQQEAEAPAEQQVQTLLEQIAKLNEDIKGNKDVMKEYKIESDELRGMTDKKKILQDAINEEKEKIEIVHAEDPTYGETKADILAKENQRREKIGELRGILKSKHKTPEIKTEDYVISGGQMKLQLAFEPQIYIDGKELK